jgi:hypothetical protein
VKIFIATLGVGLSVLLHGSRGSSLLYSESSPADDRRRFTSIVYHDVPRLPFAWFVHWCRLFFDTDNFGVVAVLLSRLVSELQEPPSPESNSGHFLAFRPSYILFLVPRNMHAKFGASRFYPFSSYKRTYKHIQSLHKISTQIIILANLAESTSSFIK